MPEPELLRFDDLERRARAAIARMGRSNPHRQLIGDLMTVAINLAVKVDALEKASAQV